MPSFKKRSLSLYLRNKCERQFVLYLYNDKERKNYGMPSREQRLGLGLVGEAGYEWQFEKVNELKEIFGNSSVLEHPQNSKTATRSISLKSALEHASPYNFIVEAEYEVDTLTFRNAVGLSNLFDYYGNKVSIGEARPDIIQVLPSRIEAPVLSSNANANIYDLEVLPNGHLISIGETDNRLRLRVIDVKLTSEPGAHYFAEVVYYSMSLAAWLEENQLSNKFVIVAAAAIWPGKHEASNLALQISEWHKRAYNYSQSELLQALETDLELALFDVFAPRIRTLLSEELPTLLSREWDELAWHVNHQCKGCEFLSANLDNTQVDVGVQRRCYPTAASTDDLSRVYGLSRGASQQLRTKNITNTHELAALEPSSQVFDIHQGLSSKRTVYPYRAQALINKNISIIPNSGGDALMPKHPDLRIFIFIDYDLSTAITVSMAIRANWAEPLPFGSIDEPKRVHWTEKRGEDEVFLVDLRNLERERQEFIKFLRQLVKIINAVRDFDTDDTNSGRRDKRTSHSKYQIYLWDEAQKKHFVRLIGRHLPFILADNSIRELVWLFPPPEILQYAEEATRRSALTFVNTVIQNTTALHVAHHYSLIELAAEVVPGPLPKPYILDLYQEKFSDLIPMERIHEYWTRKEQWLATQNRIISTTRAKVYALSLITEWLQRQLAGVLSNHAAPPVVGTAQSNSKLPQISQLWSGFTELNAAVESFEIHSDRAMPPHERIARFKSAFLISRLEQSEKLGAIEILNSSEGTKLVNNSSLFIYRLDAMSVDVNLQKGDFLYALSPRKDHGFLDKNAYSITKGTGHEKSSHYQTTVEEAQLTQVTVLAIDRDNQLIALEAASPDLIAIWEQRHQFDFTSNVMLDPIYRDFLSKKVAITLKGIGNPPSATSNPQILSALGQTAKKSGNSKETPAAEILWNAKNVQMQIANIDLPSVRTKFEEYLLVNNSTINHSQWMAWQAALQSRFSLLWGPPGTGKSHTLRTIILGAIINAKLSQQPVRLLITSNTYNAIDNVLLELERELRSFFHTSDYYLCRIYSKFHAPPSSEWSEKYPSLHSLILNRFKLSSQITDLLLALEQPEQVLIVGCPPQQLHNLAVRDQSQNEKATIKPWFDYIIVDEASQIDVATGTLIFSKLAPGGKCIVAGDDKQLPPIHQAEPPKNLEDVVGSLYNFFRYYNDIQPTSLDINYRSNRTIVEFTKRAGYSQNLESHSPDLTLNFVDPLPQNKPDNWPQSLEWTTNWHKFLDPDFPAVSYVYSDNLSSQVNDFEVDVVASLIWLMHGRIADQLLYEHLSDNIVKQYSGNPYNPTNFWRKAIGIVTPHRAQRSKVINRLKQLFPDDSSSEITDAVDTVERYQGQQRDVIIASFGIGDPDLISSEDEFLYNLNRFNVLISRARAKVIVLCTKSLLQHLSDDVEVLEESRLLKGFVESFCQNPISIQLSEKTGTLRRRRSR